MKPRDLRLLRRLLDDYQHCAPDESGQIDSWRMTLILNVDRLLRSLEV